MPRRNVVKTYVKDGFYHAYNRGVEKRDIFMDDQDYKVFLAYLKEYLSPPPNPQDIKQTFTLKGSTFKGAPKQPKNHSEVIELIAFCLMPNHFHLLLKQKTKDAMSQLLRSLSTRYSMYFNKKYKRVGSLFQGTYRAVLVQNEEYLLHLSRYIHLNPKKDDKDITEAYSSYSVYLGDQKIDWLHPDVVLSQFNEDTKNASSYKGFMESFTDEDKDYLKHLTLEPTL